MAKPIPTTPKQDADKILQGIAKWIRVRGVIGRKVTAEIKAVHQRYGDQLRKADMSITALEKALEKLVKLHEQSIMDGRDRVELPAGSILVKRERRVKRIKGMLARLKRAGLKVAIRTPRQVVDWDVVEKFNDNRLESLGTQRVEKTLISYELKDSD